MAKWLPERFDTHVAMCSALGLAAVAAAPCDEAEAADIISYQPNGGAGWTIPATLDGLYINVETQATSTLTFAGFDLNPWGESTLGWFNNSPTDGRGSMVYPGQPASGPPGNLPLGTVVGASQTFTGFAQPVTFGGGTGQWVLNASNYLGFSFNGGDGFQRYGWLRIDIGASATTRTIMEVGYNNTPGGSILVGQVVPEPSTVVMGLLATGATGVLAWRRRKRQAS